MSNKTTPVSYMGKHTFTPKEREQILEQMLSSMRAKEEIEEELKASKSNYKSKIDTLAADVKLKSNLLNAGFENRPFNCNLVLNFDETRREYYEQNTGKLVGTEPLTSGDYQTQLAIDEATIKQQNEAAEQLSAERVDLAAEVPLKEEPDYSADPFSDPMELQETQPFEAVDEVQAEPAIEPTPEPETPVVEINKPTKKEDPKQTVKIEPAAEINPFGDDEDEDFNFDDLD